MKLLNKTGGLRTCGSQRGAILVIALILLVVMTLIGVTGMQSATLQEKMSANTRQKVAAKNAAETALREAEDWLDANMTSSNDITKFNGADGLYAAVPTHAGASDVRFANTGLDITDPSDWSGLGNELTIMDDDLVSRQPRYFIEYIGRDMKGTSGTQLISLDSEAQGDGEVKPFYFRIIAIGWGRNPNIYSVLESTYVTGYGTGNFTY